MVTFSLPTSVTETEIGLSPGLILTDSSAMKMAGSCGMVSVRVVFPRPLLLWSNYHTALDLFYYVYIVLDYMLLLDQIVRYKQLLTEVISQTFLIQPTTFV